jgi:ELP3 family radical SAM enzyme/protein acetyltransferase
MQDIESFQEIKLKDENKIKCFVRGLIEIKEESELESKMVVLRKKFHIMPSKNHLRYVYETYFADISIPSFLNKFLILKSMRSRSGVLVSTIVLKPSEFSCSEKCAYCPLETDLSGNPTQPKSYLSSEPAMLRALQYKFDVKGQLYDRINCYIRTGNIKMDDKSSYKFEIILSGGTWECYPISYRNEVMTEIYWAANTYQEMREMKTLEEEILINETSTFRIIGLTIETRPDYVTQKSIKDYRRWGVTRVQLGVQHYDDNILELLNRNCYTHHVIDAIHMLKQTGFKVVCHLMPDLPGSSPERDAWMFQQSIHNSLLQFDDVKIYPTAICQSSDSNLIITSTIAEWYKEGSYKPYSEVDLSLLMNVLKEYKINIQPWVRIQRLVRDIPSKSIEAGYQKYSNLRQMLHDEMKKEGKVCQCIRCMEIDDLGDNNISPTLVVRSYPASYGTEYFISYEWYPTFSWLFSLYLYFFYWSGDKSRKAIIGFCRLRIDKNPGGGFINELKDCGLIRELHVYGSSLQIGKNGSSSQHKGYGQKLMIVAEDIMKSYGLKKSAVIAGVGTREYYKNKCGYHLEGTYMVKELKQSYMYIWVILIFVILLI